MQWPFGEKKGKGAINKIPSAERVSTLSHQGFSDTEIIRAMRGEGYSPLEVDEGMRSAVKTAAAPPEPRPPVEQQPAPVQRPPEPIPKEMPPPETHEIPGLPELPGTEGLGEIPDYPDDIDLGRPESPAKHRLGRDTEELVEAVTDEKLDAVREDIREVKTDTRDLRRKVEDVETKIQKLAGTEKTEVTEIRKLVTGYGDSISEMAAKMESIEAALKDSLRPMLQTMRSLSETVKELKDK
ncbi:MAG: hypothetical protein ISS36_03490 [Candidatus Aenigmarchaeota archaeon]|nr:hypothetical protein [Candidatus Aenigmarchaeota archaeon]